MEDLFLTVVNMSLTGSLVILLVLLGRLLLRKSPKIFSYALWSVVLFRLLCPVSLPSPVSLLAPLKPATATAQGPATYMEYVVTQAPEVPEAAPEVSMEASPEKAPSQAATPEISPKAQKSTLSAEKIAAWVWLIGAVTMALVGIGSYLRFRQKLTGAVRKVKNVYLVDHLDSAFVAGMIFPKIYLPSDLPDNQLPYILAHERHHIRRGDPIVRHLAYAALCLHWFNPLVWLAFVLSGRDLEMSCDEAVLRKLGSHIRADYAASLLTLALGREIWAATPLAFGEGDTKGRIENMKNWKKPKAWVSALSFLLCFALLTACAANPTAPVVVSKNDGSLNIETIQPTSTQPEVPEAPKTQTLQYSDHFQSTDGSVDITIDLDEELPTDALPMVEVEPRYLTGSDAKRVAQVIFGSDAAFYEQRPSLSDEEIFSKSEIAEKLGKWQTWLDLDYMTQLYGGAEAAQYQMDIVKLFIDDYTERFASAPEADPRTPCQWTLKTDSAYLYDDAQLETWDTSEDCMSIQAEVEMDGIPYRFSIGVREGSDFQLNNIYAAISDVYGPSTIGWDECFAKLTRTEKPDQSQIAAIQAKAETWLAQMDLGDWTVDQCYLVTQTYHGTPEYYVTVTATPVLEGYAAIRQPNITTPRANPASASHYYMTDATFQFAPGGELINMQITSTIDVAQVVQSNVATLSLEELLEQARTQLTLTEAGSFFWPQDLVESYEEIFGEEIQCTVTANRAEYGLVRIKVPDSDDHYSYVPALMLTGNAEYRGRNTGTVYEQYSSISSQPYYLLCLNANDGSNIPLGE